MLFYIKIRVVIIYEETFQKMADNIDKYTAINSNDGTNPIKGDIIRQHRPLNQASVFVVQV